jgi:hypothetical protein
MERVDGIMASLVPWKVLLCVQEKMCLWVSPSMTKSTDVKYEQVRSRKKGFAITLTDLMPVSTFSFNRGETQTSTSNTRGVLQRGSTEGALHTHIYRTLTNK